MSANLLEASANHLVSLTVEDWLSGYAKHVDIAQLEKGQWETLVDQVHDSLIVSKTLSTSGWPSVRDMATKGADEDTTFAGVGKIAEAVCLAAITHNPGLKPTTEVQCCPRETTQSELHGSSSMPDACATIYVLPERPIPFPTTRRSERIAKTRPPNYKGAEKLISTQTVDTAMVAEFKLRCQPETCQQNEAQILGGASHILFNDPRRRFVYGLTIEGDTMRLWHFSRSQIAISEGSNYHENPKLFIHFLLFILFAPPVALGFDMTIKRLLDEKNEIAYLYNVGDDWYQTVGNPLSEESCLPVISRATRVWLVRKVIGTNEDGTNRRKAIQDAIFSSLRGLDQSRVVSETSSPSTGSIADEARPYFMTILEDVRVQQLERDDITPSFDPWTTEKPTTKYAEVHTVKGARREANADHIRHLQSSIAAHKPIFHTPRVHRRTVFKERCETIYELLDFRDVTECIQHNLKGLWYMRLAGFIHGDISAGNCLWYKAGGQGKISDLEYAKLYDQISLHDVPTGTPQFMSIESQVQTFKLMGAHWTKLPFTYNFFHDVESLLWIYIWFLFHRIPQTNIEPPPPILEELRAKQPVDQVRHVKVVADETQLTHEHLEDVALLGRNLFACDSYGTVARFSFIVLGEDRLLRSTLMPVYANFPHFLDPIKIVLDVKAAFEKLEASKPTMSAHGVLRWDSELFTEELYIQFRAKLQDVLECVKTSGKAMVTLAPGLQPMPPTSKAKRQHKTVHPFVNVSTPNDLSVSANSAGPSRANKRAKRHL